MYILEIFDVVDENGNPVGETVERGRAHAEGIRHRTAHIWIIREKDGRVQVLLQKRSAEKDSFPGRFDTSSAGHIQAGDEPRESALRELKEELGIEAEKQDLDFAGTFRIQYDLEFHGKPFRDNEVAFVYVYRKNVDETRLVLQTEELECTEWFDLKETYRACLARDQKFCVPIGGLKVLMEYLDNVYREDTYAGNS
jgi:isopentenyldiphosphate isomerase